jgi:sec-independent protein translocase protein TatA
MILLAEGVLLTRERLLEQARRRADRAASVGSLPGLTGPDLKGKCSRRIPRRRATGNERATEGRGVDCGKPERIGAVEMPDWGWIVLVVAVVFGASKLPDIARNLGRSSGEFKKGLKEGNEGDEGTTPPSTSAGPTTAAPPSGLATDGDQRRPETSS